MNFGLFRSDRFGQAEDRVDKVAKLAFVQKLRSRGTVSRTCSPAFYWRFSVFAETAPIPPFPKRAGEAPCPPPPLCMGCPFPPFRVSPRVPWSDFQMASQE